jgi:GT2 family glycosyltransferase
MTINETRLTLGVLEALASLSQRDWAVQLILLDNGSERGEIQILRKWFTENGDRFGDAHLHEADTNIGCSAGRNFMLKRCNTDRILFLDNDLELPSDAGWLEDLWHTLDDNTDAGIVGPVLEFAKHPGVIEAAGIGFTESGRVGYLWRGRSIDDLPPGVLSVAASPSACWLVRREAQQAVGLFSEEFYPVQYEDVDFCVRMGLVGWSVLCNHSVRVRHVGNVTTRNLKDHPFERLTVRQGMRFKEKWAEHLPKLATISEADINWGPVSHKSEATSARHGRTSSTCPPTK